MTVYTIGHSTRTWVEFLTLLGIHRIGGVADVRVAPGSRRHPHFDRHALEAALTAHGVSYRHLAALGGRRRPRPDSVNTGWRHPAFRGYADYMQTGPFAEALEDLLRFAAAQPVAIMCAEATWWTCHRRLLADALVIRGVHVLHIASSATPKPHALSEFARVDERGLTYPGLLQGQSCP
jgi:uncharacterized protein (DUF488 family)